MQELCLLNYHPIPFLANLYSSPVPARVCNEALGNYSSEVKGGTKELKIQKKLVMHMNTIYKNVLTFS